MERGTLGNAIKKAREEKQYSQEKLAELLDISAIHLKHIEGGNRYPSVEVLFRAAKILNLSLDSLIFPQEEESRIRGKAIRLLDSCTPGERRVVIDLMESLLENRT